MKRLALTPGCLAIFLMVSCSAPQPVEKKVEAPPQPLTGLSALFHMYQVARSSWAHDAQVVKMSSMHVEGVAEPAPGQAAAWEATFYSPSLGRARSYTDSIVEQLPDLHKDVFAGFAESYTGPSFLIAAVQKDSDLAYQTALAKESKAAAKYAGKPVLVLLEKDPKFGDPAWRIIWGESVSTAAFSVYIDASTGQYLDTMH